MRPKTLFWTMAWTFFLLISGSFVLVDAFVLPHQGEVVYTASAMNTQSSIESSSPNTSESADSKDVSIETTSGGYYYQDANMTISIVEAYDFNSVYYVADIVVSDPELLKTALAYDTYGQNYVQTTSQIAEAHKAIFAVNGDYYGFRSQGIVMRNGQILRTSVGNATSGDALLILEDGRLLTMDESEIPLDQLETMGVEDILSFGPTLLENGEIVANTTKNSTRANPRTAIGQIDANHFIIIVVDGRTNLSQGMTTDELAQIFKSLGCTSAYNLDGGGSSTMWFQGEVINNPTDGKSAGERKVSDILYFGY